MPSVREPDRLGNTMLVIFSYSTMPGEIIHISRQLMCIIVMSFISSEPANYRPSC